jgi:hypothetical protein
MPSRRRPLISPDEKFELDQGHLAEYEPGVLDRRVASPWDANAGETWAVSEEALRAWAERVGLEPDAVVEHEAERFRGGRRGSPPPVVVWREAEAAARGVRHDRR